MIEHKQLGPIEITCDAPPYYVVRACHLIGFETPEDVRWRHLDHHDDSSGWRRLWQSWQRWFGVGAVSGPRCSCHAPVPALDTFTFTFVMNRSLTYRLGQCPYCRTVFWGDA